MRLPLPLFALLPSIITLAACGLNRTGSDVASAGDTTSTSGPDGSGEANDASSPIGAASTHPTAPAPSGTSTGSIGPRGSDAGAAVDPALDATPADAAPDVSPPPDVCPPAPPDAPLVAWERPAGIAIDGDLSDWKCVTFLEIDPRNAAEVTGTGSVTTPSHFAVGWDQNFVYFAADVVDAHVTGNSSPNFLNDAVEFYISGSPSRSPNYAPTFDHQFVVDHNNTPAQYEGGTAVALDSSFTSAVRLTTTGYSVEAKLAARSISRPSFARGSTLAFDFQADKAETVKGTPGQSALIWTIDPSARCKEPSCNPQAFANLPLE